jgi:hypothetical protein
MLHYQVVTARNVSCLQSQRIISKNINYTSYFECKKPKKRKPVINVLTKRHSSINNYAFLLISLLQGAK